MILFQVVHFTFELHFLGSIITLQLVGVCFGHKYVIPLNAMKSTHIISKLQLFVLLNLLFLFLNLLSLILRPRPIFIQFDRSFLFVNLRIYELPDRQ